MAYKRRAKSCSYIVEFRQFGNTHYGTVNYYLLARNTGFAVISMFQKRGNICSFGLEKQDDSMISLFIERHSWKTFSSCRGNTRNYLY